MVNLAFIIHSIILFVSTCLILIIVFLVFKDFEESKKMNTFKIVLFLTSLTIALNSHELVYYNYLKMFKVKPTIY